MPRAQPPVKTNRNIFGAFVALVLTVSLAGCSAGLYQHWADQQVDQIVRSRQDATLGYQPQMEAPVTVAQTPPKQAFAKVPPTPKPPPTTAPIQPSEVKLPFGPLGPEMLFP